jgi:hypothetical protein
MSDNLFVFTETLPLPDAKKLLGILQKPGKKGAWQDWSGEGGSDREVKLECVSESAIGKIILPNYINSIRVEVNEDQLSNSSAIPEAIFLGGDDWVIPDYDCDSSVRFEIIQPKLAYPMLYSFSKLTNMRFFRNYNVCDQFFIETSFASTQFPERPSAEAVEPVVNELKDRFRIPGTTDEGFLGELTMSSGGLCYDFEPMKNKWRSEKFRNMVETLVSEVTSDSFKMFVDIAIGSMMKFHGESRNVREDAQELLKRISEKNSYSSYDVTYHVVGPQDWKSRENSRKKWKKPIHQELGTATLEDGTTATVSLRIEKEGYVFTMDFENVDGLAAFRETKLFQKTHWNLGAE